MQTTADPAADEVAEEQRRSWRDEHIENVLNTRLGYEGMMLDKLVKQNADVRSLARQAREGTIGQPDAATAAESDEMGVSIGNKTFNTHHHYPSPQETLLSDTDNPWPLRLAKAGIIAAAIASGGGLGLGLAALLRPTPPAVTPPAPSVDRDTYLPYEFSIE